MRVNRIWKSFLLTSLALTLVTGCDSGSSSPPPREVGVTYSPGSGSPPANSISLQEESSTTTSITLEVFATSVTDLYGVSFDLTWNPAFLNYQSPSQGSFLGSDGGRVTFNVELADVEPGSAEDRQQGRINAAITLVGALPGVSGSGKLLSLTFTSVAAGTTAISFEGFAVFDSTGGRLPSSFHGGTITVTQ